MVKYQSIAVFSQNLNIVMQQQFVSPSKKEIFKLIHVDRGNNLKTNINVITYYIK